MRGIAISYQLSAVSQEVRAGFGEKAVNIQSSALRCQNGDYDTGFPEIERLEESS